MCVCAGVRVIVKGFEKKINSQETHFKKEHVLFISCFPHSVYDLCMHVLVYMCVYGLCMERFCTLLTNVRAQDLWCMYACFKIRIKH